MQRSNWRKLWQITAGAALAFCVAVAPAALAQGVTTGSLSGVVTDEEGTTALPGATITLVHQPTGTVYNSTSRDDGRFTFQNVRPGGPYSLTIEMDGFKTLEQIDLYVNLGETTNLNLGMRLATVEEAITVTGEANPLINPSRTGATSNVSQESIEYLPTISRGIEDFARTNPFFNVSAENESPNSLSVAGRNTRYNNIQIDGAVNNDLFGLADTGTPGGQTSAAPISLDAIEQIQLLVAPFDVRQGGFSGGGVNAITRSGTNDFNGSVFYFTRDDSLVGDGPDSLGEFRSFEEEQFGFRIGGPIKRDKIFFFANGEITDKEEPTGFSIDGSSGQPLAGGRAVDAANLFRNTLINTYGFDPGGLGEATRETPSDKFFARLDFNLNSSNNLTFRHNYVQAENDINRPDTTFYEFPSEAYFFENETNSTVAQLNSVISPSMFNEARISFQTIRDRRSPKDDVRFPWIEIENVPLAGNPNLFTGVEFEVGSEPFSTHNSLDQDIFEITDDVTWVKGNHTLVLGTHNEFFSFDNLFIQNGFGAYEFTTLADFVAGRPARRYQFTFVPEGQSDSQKFDVQQLGLYAGDTWTLRPNVTLSGGLRVDALYFPDDPTRNPFVEQTYGFRTDELPDGKAVWSPRVGFNWDINGDGVQQLRGGLGLFAGRTPYVWISNQYARTGIEQVFITASNVPFVADPDDQPRPTTGNSVGEFNLVDPDFEFPQVLRLNLAYDRKLPWFDLVASVEAVYADSQKEIDYRDANLVPTGNTLAFDGRPTFRRLNSGVTGAYVITNTNEGEQTNVALKVERPAGRGLWGFVAYAYGDSKVVNEGTSSRAVSNFQFQEALNPNDAGVSTSDFEVEHRFSASLAYRFNSGSRWPTTVSGFYNHQSGRPYSYIFGFQNGTSNETVLGVSGGINGDNYFSNDLLYVPSGPGDVLFINPTNAGTRTASIADPAFQAAQWAALNDFIGADDCLDSHRGGVAPRNCSSAPWYHSLDLAVAQEIPVGGTSFELTLDIANVVNLIDEDSGTQRYVNFGTVSPVAFQGFDRATGKPVYSLNSVVNNPDSRFLLHTVNSRWRAKLGVRFSF